MHLTQVMAKCSSYRGGQIIASAHRPCIFTCILGYGNIIRHGVNIRIYTGTISHSMFSKLLSLKPIPESLALEKNNFVADNENVSPVTDEIH